MERTVRVFKSFEEAESADVEELARLSPQERLDLAIALIARRNEALGEAGRGLARVIRIVPLDRS